MIVAENHKRFVLPFVESDWYELVRGMASAFDEREPRAMSDVVREANHGVKRKN